MPQDTEPERVLRLAVRTFDLAAAVLPRVTLGEINDLAPIRIGEVLGAWQL